MNLPARAGAWVWKPPFEDTPAGKAGVRLNDVIVDFANVSVSDLDDLQEIVEKQPIGSKQTMTVMRDGKKISLTVAVEAFPEELQQRRPARTERTEKKKDEEKNEE